MLTLRHLLEFIFTEEAFRVPEIAKNFYARKDINFKELRKARIPLVKLRNYIAHFNFNEYSSDKAMYLHCLMLYELSLGCSLGQFAYLPNNLGYKPNMNTIISTIYDLCPDLLKKMYLIAIFRIIKTE